jgi:hypothetical protein
MLIRVYLLQFDSMEITIFLVRIMELFQVQLN